MPTLVVTVEQPNQSPNASLPAGIFLRSPAPNPWNTSTLPGLSGAWPAVLSVSTLSLSFVLNKLITFWNALCLEILFQPVLGLPQHWSPNFWKKNCECFLASVSHVMIREIQLQCLLVVPLCLFKGVSCCFGRWCFQNYEMFNWCRFLNWLLPMQ